MVTDMEFDSIVLLRATFAENPTDFTVNQLVKVHQKGQGNRPLMYRLIEMKSLRDKKTSLLWTIERRQPKEAPKFNWHGFQRNGEMAANKAR
jgi:hypothetical protein